MDSDYSIQAIEGRQENPSWSGMPKWTAVEGASSQLPTLLFAEIWPPEKRLLQWWRVFMHSFKMIQTTH
jgi:hypothetical protein